MNDDVLNSIQAERSEASESHIMVVGVGGGGSNAVNFMRELHIQDVNYMVCNTDQQALDISPVELKVRLGASGEGAGNNPAEGRRAAIESLDVIKHNFQNYSTKMVFIAAAMGGGTGTGASPVIAKLAREMGILSVAIVTTPIRDEGPLRYQQALEGIEELRQSVDSLLIIDSDHIAKMALNMKFNDAMSLPDRCWRRLPRVLPRSSPSRVRVRISTSPMCRVCCATEDARIWALVVRRARTAPRWLHAVH